MTTHNPTAYIETQCGIKSTIYYAFEFSIQRCYWSQEKRQFFKPLKISTSIWHYHVNFFGFLLLLLKNFNFPKALNNYTAEKVILGAGPTYSLIHTRKRDLVIFGPHSSYPSFWISWRIFFSTPFYLITHCIAFCRQPIISWENYCENNFDFE